MVRIYLNEEVRNPDSKTLKPACREINVEDLVKVQTEFPTEDEVRKGILPKFFVEVPEEREELAKTVLAEKKWIGVPEDASAKMIDEGSGEISEEEIALPLEDEYATDSSPTPLTVLGLPTRTLGILDNGGVVNVEQIAEMTEEQLIEIKGVGPKIASDLKGMVNSFLGSTE